MFAPTWEHRIVTHPIMCMCSVVATSDGMAATFSQKVMISEMILF